MKKLLIGWLAALTIALSFAPSAEATVLYQWVEGECVSRRFHRAPGSNLDYGNLTCRRADGTYFYMYFAGRTTDGHEPVTETQACAVAQLAMTAGVRINAGYLSDYYGYSDVYVITSYSTIYCNR